MLNLDKCRFFSLVIFLCVVICSNSFASVEQFSGQGFDKCEIPTISQMQNWSQSSPYDSVNLYIGGSSRSCSNSALTSSFISQLSQQGWKFIPTWVGPQAPCGSYSSKISGNTATAYQQGVNEANSAINTAVNLGLASADGSGTVIYYDLENYDTTNTTCRDAVKSFISGWTYQIHQKASKAGVYGSSCGSAISDFASIPNIPDAIWPAAWINPYQYRSDASVYGVSCLSDGLWSLHERVRQYAGGHTETYGGVSLNIDSNIIDGYVVSVNSAPALRVTNPLSGYTWDTDTTHTVEWEYSGFSGNILIHLYKGGTAPGNFVASLAASTPVNDKTELIALPSGLTPGEDYIIGIAQSPSGTPSNFSGYFAIRNLDVTYPNGGESFIPGQSIDVRWNSGAVTDSVIIHLYKNGVFNASLNSGTANDGNENVIIPSSLTSGNNYEIGISSYGGYVSDFSDDYFTIASASPTLKVTNPLAGYTWDADTTHTVEWDYSGFSGNIAIDLYKGNTNLARIVSSVPSSDRAVQISLPTGLTPGEDYRIGISQNPSGSPWNFSGYFAIRNIDLTYPNGAESFAPGQTVNVRWNFGAVTGNIAIDLYKGSVNQQRLNSGTSVSDGNEDVIIPTSLESGNDYRIAISGHNGYVSDFSDGYFSVFSGDCINGQTRLCPKQKGVCGGSYETCIGNYWPGCTAVNYGSKYEEIENSFCDGVDNDCNGAAECNCVDNDHDGTYLKTSSCPIGNDCNDNNFNIFPGAREINCNGIDENCNGKDQCACVDNDYDGYNQSGSGCGVADCNDANTNIRPFANEIYCNGIDEDCDGADDCNCFDNDNDGYYKPSLQCFYPMGNDCNDYNVSVHPNATEICDGIDNDCNGEIDEGCPAPECISDNDCSGGKICESNKCECQNGNIMILGKWVCDPVGIPKDTSCTKGWPAHQGEEIYINEPVPACDLFEVTRSDLLSHAEHARDCCIGQVDGGYTFGCSKHTNKYVQESALDKRINYNTLKKCIALYIIDGFGPDKTYMQGYYQNEINCGDSYEPKISCYDKKHNVTKSLLCQGIAGQPYGWASDNDMSKNSCVFSDLPAHVSINILSTGTCVDYSVSLTTLLRMSGFKSDEVYSVSGPEHEFNLLKFPEDNKFTFVDTTNNKKGYNSNFLPQSFYDYNKYDINSCTNDEGESICPGTLDIYNSKENIWSSVLGIKWSDVENQIPFNVSSTRISKFENGLNITRTVYGNITIGEIVLVNISVENKNSYEINLSVKQYVPGGLVFREAKNDYFGVIAGSLPYFLYNLSVPVNGQVLISYSIKPISIGEFSHNPTIIYSDNFTIYLESQETLVLCISNKTCDEGTGENYLSCPQDCSSGAEDGICNPISDEECDVDCARDLDSDCKISSVFNKTFGGSDNDYGRSVLQTSDGGFAALGYTYSFGSGQNDIWLVKTDANGNILWNKTFGSQNFEMGFSIVQTSDLGYAIAGYNTFLASGNQDAWLIKTDSNGNHLWNKTFVGSGSERLISVKQTSDGGFIAAGYTNSFGAGSTDVWLIKTNSNGNHIWNKTFGGLGNEEGRSVFETSDGGYIITGFTMSFGTGGSSDVWLIKTDSNGNHIWNKTFGGTETDDSYYVQQTKDGGFIICGRTYSFTKGSADVWLIKVDSDGNHVWNKTFGGINYDVGWSAQQTADSGYVIAGITSSFGAGSSDVWVIKTDSNGNMNWNKTFGGSGSESGESIGQTYDRGYVILASTNSFGVGNNDFWLIKYNFIDSDSDGISDEVDNCPDIKNQDQLDSNSNGIGDVCEFSSFNISLNSNWNLISLPILPQNSSISNIMNTCSYNKIWSYDNENKNWKSTDSGLTNMNIYSGYWIDRNGHTGDCIIQLRGTLPTSTVINISKGWNLVGYPSTAKKPITNFINNSDYDTVWMLNGSFGWVSTDSGLADFEPGKGYWINTQSTGSYIVN